MKFIRSVVSKFAFFVREIIRTTFTAVIPHFIIILISVFLATTPLQVVPPSTESPTLFVELEAYDRGW